jgi:kumamolisin
VRDVSLAGRSMHVRGTAEQLRAAFGAQLGIYENADQGTFRGREGSLAVPTALAGIITGVFGLDNRRMARRKSTPGAPQQPAITPPELESLYQFPAGDAAGQHIAVAEFGGSYFPSDLQAFCQKYGRPVPAVTPVALGSPLLTLQQIEQLSETQRDELLGESFEVMMDVEIIAGLCPAADISVYFAPFTEQGWIDVLNAAVVSNLLPPVALSVSWGLPEDDPSWSDVARNEINQRLQAASMLGVTVCVSAGDDGAGDQIEDGKAHVNFPATSPFVLSVGGTSLTGTPPEEVVWWDAPGDRAHKGGSSGGGVSVVFPRPAWQTVTVASLNPGAIDGRVVPDVAALSADPLYDLTFVGRDIPNGGTSASTPLWAALLARITAQLPAAQQRRFLTPLLYGTSDNGQTMGEAGCTDITSGSNRSTGLATGYRAGPGYDAVTGWGSPLGTRLVQLLS